MKTRNDYLRPESKILRMETEAVMAASNLLGMPGVPFEGDLINEYDESF